MTFDGNEGEVVTLAEAASWTANYRSANPGAIKAHAAGKNKLNSILNQDGCLGIRTYYAIDSEDALCLVMVGVDANGDDMENGVILERMSPCPPYCSGTGTLNGSGK